MKSYNCNILKRLRVLLLLLAIICSSTALAQEPIHPRVYITDQNKAAFLKSIENVAWKKELIAGKKERLQKYIQLWQNDSEWLVSRLQMNWKTKHDKVYLKEGDFSHSEGSAPVPTVRFSGTRDWATEYKTPSLETVEPYLDDSRGLYLEHKKTGKKEWVHPKEAGHIIEGINRKVMSLIEDAAFLYWLTGDKVYAEFASPVYMTYIDGMYHRDAPVDLSNSNQQFISGLATFEVIHEKVLVHLITSYDFLYNYFNEHKLDVSKSEAVFQKWGDQIIKNGIPNNNWNLFQARFLTYVALVLEPNEKYDNGKGSEYFIEHTFETSTDRQTALKESLLVYDQTNGIWPESASYSVHVITTLLNIITLLDNATNTNELANFPVVEKAALSSFQYLFPSGYTIGFGDSNHKKLPAENFELLIANYNKYDQKDKLQMIAGLLNDMIVEGDYERKAKDLFQLFFYVDSLEFEKVNDGSEIQLTTPTFYAPNVSWFNQRIGTGENAMMIATTASYGNHTHANGVSIELYAAGYVLGPDMGKGSSYWHDDHRQYYSRMPAHNTVVVDGISDYEAMRSYHAFKLENSFPLSGESPSFDKVTFSNVSFFEPITKAKQQRFTSSILGPSGQGYVLDIFRSKKQNEGVQRHDYFYHNLGTELTIKNNQNDLALESTNDLGSHQGDLVAYDYLKEKKKVKIAEDFTANFNFNNGEKATNLMEVFVKGSTDQSVYTAMAPKSKALTNGTAPKLLVDKPIPTLIVQRNAEAWNNPFAMVFNPASKEGANSISNVQFSKSEQNASTQFVEVTFADGITKDRFTVNDSDEAIIQEDGFFQNGFLSILRKKENSPSFIFLSGMYKYEQENWGVLATGNPATVSFEITKEEITIQSSDPIVFNIPQPEVGKEAILFIYEGEKLIDTRKGLKSWVNGEQLEFRLSKGYAKAIVKIRDIKNEE